MRLYDRLMVETPRPCFGDDPRAFATDEDLQADKAQVFEITDVANWFFDLNRDESQDSVQMRAKQNDKGEYEVGIAEYFGFKWSDLGCVMPPFPHSFFEFQAPDNMTLVSSSDGSPVRVSRAGCMVRQFTYEEISKWVDEKGKPLLFGGSRLDAVLRRAGRNIDWDTHSMLALEGYVQKERQGLMGPVVTWLVPIDDLGSLILSSTGEPLIEWIPPRSKFRYDDRLVDHFALVIGSSCLIPALLACNVMHTPEEEEWHVRNSVQPNRQLSKRHLRREGRPLVSYTEVKIGGIKRRVREEAEAKGKQPSLRAGLIALHNVRAHYATYRTSYLGRTVNPRSGKPLSEDPIRVLRPAHKRGNPKHGRRDHHYTVNLEKTDQ